MKWHGFPFVAAMVLELLAGRKTQTRRLLSNRNCEWGSASKLYWEHGNFAKAFVDNSAGPDYQYLHVPCHRGDEAELVHLDEHWRAKGQEHGYREQYPDRGPCDDCDRWDWRMTSHRLWPRFHPGDRIWAREILAKRDGRAYYAADGHPCAQIEKWPWARSGIPSIHMPRRAARITREITSVRVQRIDEISEEDAVAEGCGPRGGGDITMVNPSRGRFETLWRGMHCGNCLEERRSPAGLILPKEPCSPSCWTARPWVLAITFKPIEEGN